MNSSSVFLNISGQVARLTLNRENRSNTLDLEAASLLESYVRSLADRADIRVLVLTGVGAFFCSGFDLEYVARIQAKADVHAFRDFVEIGKRLILLFRRMPQLVIASVNGSALGAGLTLALACDWCLASDQAYFGDNCAQTGLFPGWGGYWLLQHQIGPSMALEMVVLGQMRAADEALDFVNRMVAYDHLDSCTDQIAAKIAAGPPLVIREIKRTVHDNYFKNCEEMIDGEIEGHIRCFVSEDCKAAVQAYLRKRKPKFEGW